MKSVVISGILTLLLTLDIFHAGAQSKVYYSPLSIQDTIPFTIHEALKIRLKKDKESVSAKGKVGTYMRTLYDQRFEYIVKTFNEDYFMVNDNITAYMQGVLSNIYDANPQLPRETTLYTYRSETPNAMSFGEGTLCVMLGLLSRIETEDVLAFVLCHELAHYHAGHTAKHIEELAALNYDKVLKKQIDEIMGSPYGRYTRMKGLFSSLGLSTTKHSREREFEADSLGLVYFRNTRYSQLAPLRCMQILDRADSSVYTENFDLKKYFGFAEFPFKESWGAYQRSDVWHAKPEYSDSDTARTHPACMRRFEALRRQLGATQVDSASLLQGKRNTVAEQAALETINSLYHHKQYGKALYHAMMLAERFPDHAYPHAMIIKCFYQLYKSQKNHELGKVLELPDPRFEENYDRLLTFIHKLRLFELAGLTYHYSATRPVEFYDDEEFLHAVWMASRLEVSKLDPEKIADDYQARYPNGRHLKEMKSK